MADEFKIEIPIEVTSNADVGQLQQLEAVLNRIYAAVQQNTGAASSMMSSTAGGAGAASAAFGQMSSSAERAGQAMQQAATAAQQAGTAQINAANNAEGANERLGSSVEELGGAYNEAGSAAQAAGSQSSSAFEQAGGSVDQFSQRVQRSQQNLRSAFAEKIQLIIDALDKAGPIIQKIRTTVKNLTAKAWHVAVRMKDFVTAPFNALRRLIMSPIMMTISMAGIGMGAGSFLSTWNEFESGMSTVKALSGATDEEFSQLSATAEELGATTKFTAAQASEGMQYLAMAGWDANQIIEAMPGLLNLAAAGATDLGTAADIVSDVMTAMGMSASEAGKAADIFAATATSTNTTVQGLGESLKYAGPVAHSFGMELDELTTIIGMMGNAGIKGSQSGTALRASLLRMAAPPKEAADAMKRLNLSFTDAKGNMKDIKTIIGDLQKSFSGLSEEEKLASAKEIFGTEASAAWLSILDMGVAEYERLYAAINGSAGAAEKMSKTQLDNLTGDITILQSALDGMKISFMKELSPYFREGVQWLTGKIPVLTEKLTNFATSAIEKFKGIAANISDVFNSDEFMNADFAGKLFIAWDKIIAEPFQNWWSGGGQEMIIGAVQKIGTALGETYHGIIEGIFAAIKGEDIDAEGMNISGFAKAGAEAAKAFVESFAAAFDLKGLIGDAPALLKGIMAGFVALKAGGAIVGVVKTVLSLKAAFAGAAGAAGAAGGAVTIFGASLASILGWAGLAIAAIVAIIAIINAFRNSRKGEEEENIRIGEAAKQMAENYEGSVKTMAEAREEFNKAEGIKLRIAEDTGGNKEVIDGFMAEISGLQAEIARKAAETPEIKLKAAIEKSGIKDEKDIALIKKLAEAVQTKSGKLTQALEKAGLSYEDFLALTELKNNVDSANGTYLEELKRDGMTEEEFLNLTSLGEKVGTDSGEFKQALEKAGITPEQFEALTGLKEKVDSAEGALTQGLHAAGITPAQFDELTSKKEDVDSAWGVLSETLLKLGVDPETFKEACGLAEDVTTKNGVLTLRAILDNEGYDPKVAESILTQFADIESDTKTIAVILGENTNLTPDQIGQYTSKLSELMQQKTEYTLQLIGSGMTLEEVNTLKARLEAIDKTKSTLYLELQKGGLTDQAETEIRNKIAALDKEAADIQIILSGVGMDDKAITDTKAALASVRGEAEGILMNIAFDPNSTIDQEELNTIIGLLDKIGDRRAEIEIQMKSGSMGPKELEDLNRQLNETYANIVELSGGYFTADDVKYGRITQERYDAWAAVKRKEAETERLNFQAQVVEDRSNVPKVVEQRDAAAAVAKENRDLATKYLSDKDFLYGLETERKYLGAQYAAGRITEEELIAKGQALAQGAANREWADKNLDTGMFDWYAYDPLSMFGYSRDSSGKLIIDKEMNPFEGWQDTMNFYREHYDEVATKAEAREAEANGDLLTHYQNEVLSMSYDSFAGFGGENPMSAASIEEVAASFADLDQAGQTMFANAVAALDQLNQSVDYIGEEEKTSVGEVLQTAYNSVEIKANAEGLGDIAARLTEINSAYQTANDSNKKLLNTQQLKAVNEALEALNLDGIEDLSELGTRLKELEGLKPENLSFDSVVASMTSLGVSTDEVKKKVESAKQQLDKLAGTYNVTINYTTNGNIPDAPGGASGATAAENATGGIYDGAFLSWVAEDGPEAIIPLGPGRRDRGLDLWMQAGEMLGVTEFADGGIMAPYQGVIDGMPYMEIDDEGSPIMPGAGNGGGGGTTIDVSVNANPTFQITGTSAYDVMDSIKGHIRELAEILGEEFAAQVGEIIQNMV